MTSIFDGICRGLSDSLYCGLKGSFYRLVGVDIHSEPGILKVRQKLSKDSGATIDSLCKTRIAASDGSTLWFSSTTGKIWRRTSGGSWSLVHTTTPVAGGAGCLGAEEFDGYIYWATESRLHRKTIADLSNWAGGVTEDWGTFTNTDASFHPMQKQGVSLFIGDGRYVAKVSGATGAHAFTANALDLKAPYRIKTMIDFDIDLLIGTYVGDDVNKTEVIRWDTESDSWQTSDPIEENGINAFIRDDNYVYVQAGQFGRIYFYDGVKLQPFMRIPGDWSPTKNAEVYPQAVSTHLTVPVFGLSNIAGNPALQGVYSFGSYSKNYDKVLDLSYPISAGALESIEIGAVIAIGADLLVSWKSGASYGVDKLDWSNKYASAYIETMVLTPASKRHFLKTLENLFANYVSLPASTDIDFKYKVKHGDSFGSAIATINDTTLMQIKAEEGTIPDISALQLRIEFTVSSNNAPEIESMGFEDNAK